MIAEGTGLDRDQALVATEATSSLFNLALCGAAGAHVLNPPPTFSV